MTLIEFLFAVPIVATSLAVFIAFRLYKACVHKDEVIRDLKNLYLKNGYSTCCKCGKMYEPANDPDSWPELNICRDCLWKLYYDSTFKEEKIDV